MRPPPVPLVVPFLALAALAAPSSGSHAGARAALSPRAAAPEAAQDLDARLSAVLADFSAGQGASELSVSVSIGGETVLARQPASGVAVADATALRPLCLAVLALVLVRQEALALDDPLSRWMPALGELGERVRVRHLLSRTSGLPPCEPYFEAHPTRDGFELGEFLAWLAKEPPLAEPGRCWAQETTDELLLGMVLELVRQRSASALLEELVFEPLEMHATARVASRTASGPLGLLGRLESTSADLARLQRALASGAFLPLDRQRPLVERARLPDGTSAGPGLGYRSTSVRAEGDGLLAGGAHEGRAAVLAYHPGQDLVIALLAPASEARLVELEARLARVLAGLEEPEVAEVPLAEGELSAFVGAYWAGCVELEVRLEEGRLVFAPAFRSPVRLVHRGERRFVAAEDSALVVEFLREDGRVASLVLDDHGTRVEARKH